MKHLIIITSLFLLTLPPLFANKAEEKIDLTKLEHPVRPLLWKLEGKELKKPSYLFGTIHVGDPRVTNLHPIAKQAFEQSDTFAAEIDMDPENQVSALAASIRRDGSSLTKEIGPTITKQLDTELGHINKELNASTLDKMKTWSVTLLISQLEEALKGRAPLDLALWNKAKETKKLTWCLEPGDSQFKFLNQLDKATQTAALKETLSTMKTYREKGTSIHQESMEFYLLGNPEQFDTMLNNFNESVIDQGANQKFMEALLYKRNDHMTKAILKMLDERPGQTHFIAAGAAHFIGKDNILDKLRKHGYTITRVEK